MQVRPARNRLGNGGRTLEPSSKARAERKALLEQELRRALEILIRDYAAEKVILFGSFAEGHVGEWSDIDLIVVKETPLRFLDRTKELLGLIRPRVGMDILVYTPSEFTSLSKERAFFRDEVQARGKVLYERGGTS